MDVALGAIAAWITGVVSAAGYWGVVLLMGIESACIPLPSEIIMPYGGYLAFLYPDRFSIWGMGLAGALGCVWGSLVGYWLGRYGGRPLIERYGRYVLIHRRDLDRADNWFKKYGDAAVFIGRLLPVVRTFISFPAGVAHVRLDKFVLYTFLGSLPWCLVLAYAGKILGEQWEARLSKYFHGADVFVIVVFLLLAAWYIYRHISGGEAHRDR